MVADGGMAADVEVTGDGGVAADVCVTAEGVAAVIRSELRGSSGSRCNRSDSR